MDPTLILAAFDTESATTTAETAGRAIGLGLGTGLADSDSRILMTVDGVSAEEIAKRSMKIAADICVYTNGNFILETLD